MDLNSFRSISSELPKTKQQASMAQDNAGKTAFALKMIERIPQEQKNEPEAPRIPTLGALAIPN